MRPQLAIGISIVTLVMLALLLWHRQLKQPSARSPEKLQSISQTNWQSVNKPPLPVKQGTTPSNPIDVKTATGNADWTREQIAKAMNVPVRFYGMVVDQNSNALSGVRVKLGIRHNVYPIPNSLEAAKYAALTPEQFQKILNPTIEVVSDNNGRFQWIDSNVTGDIVGVGSLVKDSYESEPGQYSCGAGSGIFDNPVTFKMWSTNIHEQLITGNKTFPIVPDGRSYLIDLIKGTISETGTGDLKVWVKRPEQISFGQRYDWSCEMEVMNGGIFQENDRSAAMYEAPANGYTNSFNYEEPASANGWGDTTGEQRFYVSLNNGQEYARISIELEAYYNNQIPGMIRLSYAFNPSGSRVLR